MILSIGGMRQATVRLVRGLVFVLTLGRISLSAEPRLSGPGADRPTIEASARAPDPQSSDRSRG